jgi:hypothetical protein
LRLALPFQNGNTPLHSAVYYGHVGASRLLLAAGADVHALDNVRSLSPKNAHAPKTHMPPKGSQNAHARPRARARTQDGGTPLHDAAVSGHIEMIRFLLDHGADATRRRHDGATCVDTAGGNEAVRSLLRYPPARPAQRAAAEEEERRRAEAAAARAAAAAAADASRAAADAAAAAAAAEHAAAEQRAAAEAAAAAARARGLTAASIAPDGSPVGVSIDYVRAATAQFAPSARLGGAQPGGFGDVFRGADAALGVRFAVKRLRADAPWPPERSAAREIQILTQFRHPHIIRLWGYTTDDVAERCLLYELGDGGALSDALADADGAGTAAALTWRARLRIASGVAAALHYLHTSSATPAWHRDVKAANVVLTAALEPKLIDCGISKLLTPDEAARGGAVSATTGVPFGTAAYMCPVYLRAPPHRYGEKAEVYSFGVLLCELTTGRLQCCSVDAAGDAVNLADEAGEAGGLAALRDARPPAWSAAEGVLGALEALAARCVKRKPDARPRFGELRAALSALRAQHATRSEEEAALAGQLAAVRAQRDALLLAREAADADAEAAAAAAAAARRDCCVFTACPPRPLTLSDGLECASGHFVCGGCLSAAVHARGDGAAERLRCLACGAGPFSDRALVLRLSEAASVQYLAQIGAAAEAAAARALEQSFEARVSLAVNRQLTEGATAALRRAVIDDILTLRCPHAGCRKAMPAHEAPAEGSKGGALPFDGCFAVACADERGHGCGGHFCGWCFAPFPRGAAGGKECHAHVATCAHNAAPGRDVWGGPAAAPLFARALRDWRAKRLHALLRPLPHAQRDALRRSLHRELADAGLL